MLYHLLIRACPTTAAACIFALACVFALHCAAFSLQLFCLQVRLLLLAGLASEHLLLLGPPGTAKSELSRRLSKLTSGKYYERLLTRFSVPEELFGPLSMRGKTAYSMQIERQHSTS